MVKVVGIRFLKKGRMYFFNSLDYDFSLDDEVIVETERGLQYGIVVKEPKEWDPNNIVSPLKDVIRKATKSDKKVHLKNLKDNELALQKAKKIVEELGLNMNLLDACYTFDRKQLLFNFTADDRVDFRELAKKLASIYRTRIELRQIGIRDKAREIGGLGPCGRFLCCNSFLTDLNSVSINMAKNQMLALNPTKINGLCGRLLCCLAYEDETYSSLKKDLPNLGDDYHYQNELYKVIEVNVFKRTIKLENSQKMIVEVNL